MVAKQAGSTSSLAAELLHKISPMPYKMYVAKINEFDAVMPDNFKNSRWANYFTADSSNIVNKEAIWLYAELFLGHHDGSCHGLWWFVVICDLWWFMSSFVVVRVMVCSGLW